MGAAVERVDTQTEGFAPLLRSLFVRESAAQTNVIVCPHCKKEFQGDLLSEGTRHEGFKCPHCRLFVPVERVEGHAA
jgi:DNA-directed RNA polymerase subunit RPC12/RpoP